MLGLALRALHISNALPFLCSRHTAFSIFTTGHNTTFFVRQRTGNLGQNWAKKHGEGDQERGIILISQKFTGEDKGFDLFIYVPLSLTLLVFVNVRSQLSKSSTTPSPKPSWMPRRGEWRNFCKILQADFCMCEINACLERKLPYLW